MSRLITAITPATLRQMAENVFEEADPVTWISTYVTRESAFVRLQIIVETAAVGCETHPLHVSLRPWNAIHHPQFDEYCTKEFYSLWLCMLAAAVETGDL